MTVHYARAREREREREREKGRIMMTLKPKRGGEGKRKVEMNKQINRLT